MTVKYSEFGEKSLKIKSICATLEGARTNGFDLRDYFDRQSKYEWVLTPKFGKKSVLMPPWTVK